MEYPAVYSTLGHSDLAFDEKINPSNAQLTTSRSSDWGFFYWISAVLNLVNINPSENPI